MDFSMKHRDEAAALDRDDPLGTLRDQFALVDDEKRVIYLTATRSACRPRRPPRARPR